MKQVALCLSFLSLSLTCLGQQSQSASINDKVHLKLDSYRGNLQWQQSIDGNSWSDLTGATITPYEAVVTQIPLHFRGKITEQNCQPIYTATLEIRNQFKRWSDAATWGGNKPVAGANVVIPAGTTILLDENPPALGGLTVDGNLEFDRKDLTLEAKWILVHGQLRVGTEVTPFEQKARIILSGTDPAEDVMGMGTRGILVMGGTLELHGKTPNRLWTKLNDHATKGSTQLKLVEDTGWKVGDEIVIAPTDFYLAGNGTSITQRTTISSISGSQLGLAEGLNAFRWGLLQYPTSTGMSLASTNLVSPPVADTEEKKTPLVLDERAEVGNITRNIVIEAPNDNLWTTQGFGVHTMIMGPNSVAHVEGVEIKRGGQRGKLARYAFHWHQLSYSGTQTLTDATGQYFRNSSVNTSSNRGVVIHGTNGVLVKNNVIYDIKGHAIFTEDAVERRNTFDGNLILYVRNSNQPLKVHEGAGGSERGSSGFWISNPDNMVINNVAADCRSVGFFLFLLNLGGSIVACWTLVMVYSLHPTD